MIRATERFGELTGLETTSPASQPRPILFVHGWWGGAWVWDRFMERFAARGHACFAIDLRGQHASKPVPDRGKITFADHLEDVRTALAVLQDPVLVTHSFSGHLALKLGETLPLAAVVHLVPPPVSMISFHTLAVMLPCFPRMLLGKPFILSKRRMLAADLDHLPPEEAEAAFAKMGTAPGTQARQSLTIGVSAKQLSGPRLIVSGTDDRLVPAKVHRKMATKFGADYREYPNHAHYLMREPGWETIADETAAWIEQH